MINPVNPFDELDILFNADPIVPPKKEWTNYPFVEEALLRRDYHTILQTPELFWVLFCKVCVESLIGIDEYFCPTLLTNNKIVVLGKGHIISAMQEVIENIRTIFAMAHQEKRNFVLLAVKISAHIFFREATSTIDLKTSLSELKTHDSWHEKYICPNMERLCAGIGATCKVRNVAAMIQAEGCQVMQNCKNFAITWIPGEHLIYQIPPNQVPPHAPLDPSLYELYEKQKFCDFTIQTRDGAIKTHAAVLYLRGGAVIQRMLSSNMKESTERTLCLEFSLNAVRAFLAFLYLGKTGLDPQEFKGHTRTLFELYEMAELFQIQPLIDCCTNLMSLLIRDPRVIESLAPYKNPHLQQLHAYLLNF